MIILHELIHNTELNYKLGKYKSANYYLETYIKLSISKHKYHIMRLNSLLYDIETYNLEYNTKDKCNEYLLKLIENIKEVVHWEV